MSDQILRKKGKFVQELIRGISLHTEIFLRLLKNPQSQIELALELQVVLLALKLSLIEHGDISTRAFLYCVFFS